MYTYGLANPTYDHVAQGTPYVHTYVYVHTYTISIPMVWPTLHRTMWLKGCMIHTTSCADKSKKGMGSLSQSYSKQRHETDAE